MSFRNVMVSSKSVVSSQNNLLKIENDKKHTVPIEDINAIVFDNKMTTVTINTLMKLSQAGVAIFVCDDRHIPCAVMTPFGQKRRSSEVVRLQDQLTVPRKKKLWQSIVVAKILNQGRCLSLVGDETGAEYLYSLANEVVSGDANNVEAVAAAYYFQRLFGNGFNRRDKDIYLNAALNYGYAIIRGQISRLLASYGFIPMKGIHHRSGENSFNLSDDFIEPFRAVVDLYVAKFLIEETELAFSHKQKLLNLLNAEILICGKKYSVMTATDIVIRSFLRVCKGETDKLELPTLVEFELHPWE